MLLVLTGIGYTGLQLPKRTENVLFSGKRIVILFNSDDLKEWSDC